MTNIITCERHGVWDSKYYPKGCPLCINEKINASKEVQEALARRGK